MTVNYRIESHGSTTQEVLKDLTKQRRGLTTKLRKGEVSTEFETSKTIYSATYRLKKGEECPVSCTTRFDTESEVSFTEVEKKAEEVSKGNLDVYDASYEAERYFTLTRAQHKAATKPTTAGRISEESSSLDVLLS